MEKALAEGTFSLVSEAELEERRKSKEPMHYVVLLAVEQPGHQGHKLRVVSNSKLKNIHAGLSVNDCMERPPNTLSPLLGVLLWWRTNLYVLMIDLARAYQALHTGPLERFTRLFLWRRQPGERMRTYGYDRSTFGDLEAATALEIAKCRAADLGWEIHPSTAQQLKEKVYSDDGALAASSREELSRMRGERREDGRYTGFVSQILDTCGMALKYILVAGEKGQEEEEMLGGAMLGVGYECGTDRIALSFPATFHQKKRGGLKEEVVFSEGELSRLRSGLGSLTLRTALSYVMGKYDPLGLASPLSMKMKLLLRRTHPVAGGWDLDLPPDIKTAWGELVTELRDAGTIFFPRSVVPPEELGQFGEPLLVGFGDGSLVGFMAMVYTVWPRRSGGAEVFLVLAKARVAPLGGTTTPRMEMSSAALLARLMVLVARSCGFKAKKVVMALDSECTVAALQKRDGVLKPYFSHRAAEIEDAIQELRALGSKVEPMVALPGEENPADLGTRGNATALDLAPASRYQQGPVFLQKQRVRWPLKTRVCVDSALEERKQVHMISCHLAAVLGSEKKGYQGAAPTKAAEMEKNEDGASTPLLQRLFTWALHSLYLTNSWDKAVRILVRIIRALIRGDRSSCRGAISAEEFAAAKSLQYLASSPASVEALKAGNLRSLGAVRVEGTVWVKARCSPEDMAAVLGVHQLRILMPSTRLAYLVLVKAHEEDHRLDPRDTLARARRECWIPKARALALKVISSCMQCRKINKKVEAQVMGDLPSYKLAALAPFTVTGCDFMGPYVVRGMCKGRRQYKVWVAVYTCLSSHAAVLLPTPGYDAATFVTTHTQFCNTFGAPRLIIVDHGGNLVAAAERPDWQEVARTSGWSDTEWKITPKGCPWRAGQVERVVGLAKRSLHHILAGQAFSGDFHQLSALLARVSFLLNSRPIATQSFTETDFHLITPNDILLGRAAKPRGEVPALEELEEPGIVKASLTHMETVARAWHSSFVKQVWPLLVPRRKWQDRKPDVKVGDVGFLLYTSKFSKPSWRACKVLHTHPDKHGVVRTVTVGLRRKSSGEGREQYRPRSLAEMVIGVQRLAITVPAMHLPRAGEGAEQGPGEVPSEVLKELSDGLLSLPAGGTRKSRRNQGLDPEM
jgi:hypothetical protein